MFLKYRKYKGQRMKQKAKRKLQGQKFYEEPVKSLLNMNANIQVSKPISHLPMQEWGVCIRSG